MSGVNVTVFDSSGEEPKEVASWQTAEDGTHTPTPRPEELGPCVRCGHPPDWHRLDDASNVSPTDPAAQFRCIGYDCESGGPPPVDRCTCPSFVQRRIPEAFGSEDGDCWWIPGHVDPLVAVLAVTLAELTTAGPDEAFEFLAGGPRIFDPDSKGLRARTWIEQLVHAQGLVDHVSHYWTKPDPDDDELQLPAVEGEPGAEPWTEVQA